MCREMLRHRVRFVIDVQHCRQGWPVVSIEHRSAQELYEPGPARAAVIVCGKMKSKPAASMLHVLLKGRPLLHRVCRIVEPHNDLNPFEAFWIQIVPVRRGLELKVVPISSACKELQRLQCKVNVVAFYICRVKRKNMELSRFRGSNSLSHNEREDCENEVDAPDH